MILSEAPGAVKQFRKKAGRFQQTFLTPLNDLQAFVKIILSGQELQGASLTIEQAVFEPKHLINLMTNHSIPPRYCRGICLTAQAEKEIVSLLQATLIKRLSRFHIHPRTQTICHFRRPR
jgi:hypothetical protein